MDEVVRKALAKKPDERYATAAEFADALRALAVPQPRARTAAARAGLRRRGDGRRDARDAQARHGTGAVVRATAGGDDRRGATAIPRAGRGGQHGEREARSPIAIIAIAVSVVALSIAPGSRGTCSAPPAISARSRRRRPERPPSRRWLPSATVAVPAPPKVAAGQRRHRGRRLGRSGRSALPGRRGEVAGGPSRRRARAARRQGARPDRRSQVARRRTTTR